MYNKAIQLCLLAIISISKGQEACTDPKSECINVKDCPFIMDILRNSTLTSEQKRNFLAPYNCGDAKACCPKSTLGSRFLASCTDPNNECKNVRDCPFIMDILRNSTLTSEKKRDFLVTYKCGDAKACCPKSTLSSRFLASCSRPQQGSCVDPRQCTYIVNILRDNTIARDVKLSTLNNHKTCSQSYLVCCPNNVAPPTRGTTPSTSPQVRIPTSNLLPSRNQCGEFKDDRIFQGNETTIYEHPWSALLQYRQGNKKDFKCGGTLISQRYVLTAAHCVDPNNFPGWSLMTVRLGETDYTQEEDCGTYECNDQPLDIRIDTSKIHEGWVSGNDGLGDDIALLRLIRNVRFSDFIRPTCLPSNNPQDIYYESRQPTAVGWGLYNFTGPSTWKLKGNMKVVDNNVCLNTFRSIGGTVTSKQLCAGDDNSVTCSGDSGGGLFLQNDKKWVQIGIVSYGHSVCGRKGYPAVFTRVSEYMDWIVRNLNA